MTAPSTAKKTSAKANLSETVKSETPETETQSETVKTEAPRVSEILSTNAILADFVRQYLEVFDEISNYNKEVLAEKDAEWTSGKVLEKGRELARPTDKDAKPDTEVKTAIEAFESLVNEMNKARKNALDIVSKRLGITLSATAERNPEIEAPMKEHRKFAVEIGTQLEVMAKMLSDEKVSSAISEFLNNFPLPAIGRDQVRTFGSDEKATPKYRVHVSVFDKDGKEIVSEDGFTKTVLALPKYYERGKAIKSDTLRDVWEKAGNSTEKTVSPTVEFTDNELHFVITKK
ncbi:MAG: hypothetical protein HMLIMOIP_002067 [Candidatus Nitrosomirales archaeon]|jgi:hypothetical protein